MTNDDHLNDADRALIRYVDGLLGSGEGSPVQDMTVHLAIVVAMVETVPRARPPFRNHLRVEVLNVSQGLSAYNKPRPGLRRIMVPSLALMFAIALLAATPWGRSFAQEIVSFFTRAESDIATEATVAPLVELQSYSTIKEAEDAVGFSARTPTTLPPEYALDSILASLTDQFLRITYQGPENQTAVMTPLIAVVQRVSPFDDLIGPETEIQAWTIAGGSAEYVEGGWMRVEATGDNPKTAFRWEGIQVPVQTLRWRSDGFYFEISFVGSDTQPGYLGKEDLINMAEGLR